MRHRNHRGRLGLEVGHRTAVLRNLAMALIEHGRIRTTEAKAKALRPFVERLVTLAKKDVTHNRRMVFADLQKKETVKKLFSDIGPRFATRPGGYTRIVHAGQRQGDASWMAFIEFVDYVPEPAAPAATEPSAEAAG